MFPYTLPLRVIVKDLGVRDPGSKPPTQEKYPQQLSLAQKSHDQHETASAKIPARRTREEESLIRCGCREAKASDP